MSDIPLCKISIALFNPSQSIFLYSSLEAGIKVRELERSNIRRKGLSKRDGGESKGVIGKEGRKKAGRDRDRSGKKTIDLDIKVLGPDSIGG